MAARAADGRSRLLRMRRHGLPRTFGDSRTAGPDGPHPRNDFEPPPHLGDQARRQGRRHDVPARFGGGKDADGDHHLAGNQQSYVHRGVMLDRLKSLLQEAPPAMAFEITEAGIASARIGARAELDYLPLKPGTLAVSPLKENVLDADEFAAAD